MTDEYDVSVPSTCDVNIGLNTPKTLKEKIEGDCEDCRAVALSMKCTVDGCFNYAAFGSIAGGVCDDHVDSLPPLKLPRCERHPF